MLVQIYKSHKFGLLPICGKIGDIYGHEYNVRWLCFAKISRFRNSSLPGCHLRSCSWTERELPGFRGMD